ncbi:transposase [Citreicella sp. 357]|nr:transposase [Citreicella sp. 357]
MLRKKNGAASEAHKSKSIQNLGSDRLYGLCSEEMKMWLDIERQRRGRLDLHSFVIAAHKRLPELGIHPSAWEEAVKLLNEDAAMLCVLITDAKVADPEITILSAGAYLRGMVRAQRTGSLNIMGSQVRTGFRRYFSQVEEYLNFLNEISSRIRNDARVAAYDYRHVLQATEPGRDSPDNNGLLPSPAVMDDTGELFLAPGPNIPCPFQIRAPSKNDDLSARGVLERLERRTGSVCLSREAPGRLHFLTVFWSC